MYCYNYHEESKLVKHEEEAEILPWQINPTSFRKSIEVIINWTEPSDHSVPQMGHYRTRLSTRCVFLTPAIETKEKLEEPNFDANKNESYELGETGQVVIVIVQLLCASGPW